MNRELDRLWRAQAPPFAGAVVHPQAMVPLDELVGALSAAGRWLADRFPAVALFSLEDWHEHDGWLSEEQATTWSSISQRWSTVDSLYESRTGNVLVSRGLYGEGGGFYLRWLVMDEDEDEQYPGRWGDFDVCLADHDARELCGLLERTVPSKLTIGRAGTYFDRRYAG